MGINEQYFSAAMERLEERRRANRLESDMRRSEVESKIPEYRELSLKLGETGSEIVRLVMRGGDTSKERAGTLKYRSALRSCFTKMATRRAT